MIELKILFRSFGVRFLISLIGLNLIVVFLLFLYVQRDLKPRPFNVVPSQIELIETEHPSIPIRYWHEHRMKLLEDSPTPSCAKFPTISQLRFENTYWQLFSNGLITMRLYNAYYDTRPALPVVRLLAMINKTNISKKIKTYCQLWYEGSLLPTTVEVTAYTSIWQKQCGFSKRSCLFPYIIDCTIPAERNLTRIPQVVSLIASECDVATNSLRIHYDMPSAVKQQFAVCVKPVAFPQTDISLRLIEWIELQRILGASKIYFYQLAVALHPNVTKVLEYYQKNHILDMRAITQADGVPHLPNLQHYLLKLRTERKARNDIIFYNDCFYRNLYRYDYVAVQGIDEVLVPLQSNYWSGLMTQGTQVMHTSECVNGYASYCLHGAEYSLPTNNKLARNYNIPNFMHILHYVQRNRKHLTTEVGSKCFHRTDRVIALDNHWSCAWLNACGNVVFDRGVAQTNHYKKRFKYEPKMDINIWRYKDELILRSMRTLLRLGYKKQKLYEKFTYQPPR